MDAGTVTGVGADVGGFCAVLAGLTAGFCATLGSATARSIAGALSHADRYQRMEILLGENHKCAGCDEWPRS
jgi:hypothetical protein